MSIATQTMSQIRQRVQGFDFKNLFLEELGWDTFTTQPLPVLVDGHTYVLHPVAQKSGFAVFRCDPDASGGLPNDDARRKIEEQVARQVREHLIIFVDAAQNRQFWQWVRRTPGRPKAYRGQPYYRGQSGEALVQVLQRMIFDFSEAAGVTIVTAARRVTSAFDVDRVTKRFYDRFKAEQSAFLAFIQGIASEDNRKWYASLMLNRLMFTYFIQKKGFLAGDSNYLPNRLRLVQQRHGQNQFHSFFRSFLLRLFHDGLGQRGHSPELVALIGDVPYLNGGLFEPHLIEKEYPTIEIPDEAFVRIFAFFDEYHWHLDERPLRADNEINPDVLGYIFEKYINQKQMGAYYTKEDITGYISKNTIIPYLFEAAQPRCAIAFEPGGEVWRLLRDDPDRYIYELVLKGVDLDLPPEIAAGLGDVSQRGGWNRPADADFALPTETWREHIARRTRCQEVREKLASGAIDSINDLITYNLHIERFAQDVLERSEGPELLRAFWHSIEQVSVLDPTCGSGAFLFAALNILEPLYEACLDRMQAFVDEADRTGEVRRFPDFRTVLARVAQHPNRRYFILKSIIINNLYGVDIMEEAVEIARLRLFLKLVAQVEDGSRIEPLPDIDFNIRAGNTLVGYATFAEIQRAVTSKFDFDDTMGRIEQKAGELERLFEQFRAQQTTHGGVVEHAAKEELRRRLGELGDELDRYLAAEYGIDAGNIKNAKELAQKLLAWRASHQPFHWFIEFYGIVHKRGGFDVIIGNPPYVEYSGVRDIYKIQEEQFITAPTRNLYAFAWERALRLAHRNGWVGFIVPISSISTPQMEKFVTATQQLTSKTWISNYAVRPSKLFVGVDMNLTIVVAQQGHQTHHQEWTTTYQRWSPAFREYLFANISYIRIPQMTPLFSFAIPKLRYELEQGVLSKLCTQKRTSELLSPQKRPTNQRLSYRTAGGRYYKIFLSRPLDSESKSNKTTSLREDIDVQVVLAALSSGVWWWYYTLHFDMYNCKDYMIFGFPFSYPSDEATLSKLKALGGLLVEDLFKNAARKTQEYATTGAREQLIFIPSRSKPIIDEIDGVLAEHYSFTEEELEFIINYDIKYRMGQNDDEGDDEA